MQVVLDGASDDASPSRAVVESGGGKWIERGADKADACTALRALLAALVAQVPEEQVPGYAIWPKHDEHLRIAISLLWDEISQGAAEVVISGHAQALWQPPAVHWWKEAEPVFPVSAPARVSWLANDEDLAVAVQVSPSARDWLRQHGSDAVRRQLTTLGAATRLAAGAPIATSWASRVMALRAQRTTPAFAVAALFEEVTLVSHADRRQRRRELGGIDICTAWFDGPLETYPSLCDSDVLARFWSLAALELLPPDDRGQLLGWALAAAAELPQPEAMHAHIDYLLAGGAVTLVRDALAAALEAELRYPDEYSARVFNALVLARALDDAGDRSGADAAMDVALAATLARATLGAGAGTALYRSWDAVGNWGRARQRLAAAADSWPPLARLIAKAWLYQPSGHGNDALDGLFESACLLDGGATERLAPHLSASQIWRWQADIEQNKAAPRMPALWRRFGEIASVAEVDAVISELSVAEAKPLVSHASRGAADGWLARACRERLLPDSMADCMAALQRERYADALTQYAWEGGWSRCMRLIAVLPTDKAQGLARRALEHTWPLQVQGARQLLRLTRRACVNGEDWSSLHRVIFERSVAALAEAPSRGELLYDSAQRLDLLTLLTLVKVMGGSAEVLSALSELRQLTLRYP